MSFGSSQFNSIISSIEKFISGPEVQNILSESLAQIKPFFSGLYSHINAVNIYETAEHVVVEIQIPGFDKSQIKMRVEGQNLMVACEPPSEKKEQTHLHQTEFDIENYTRSILLPPNTDTSKVQANMSKGILTVRFAKLSETEKVEIIIE